MAFTPYVEVHSVGPDLDGEGCDEIIVRERWVIVCGLDVGDEGRVWLRIGTGFRELCIAGGGFLWVGVLGDF